MPFLDVFGFSIQARDEASPVIEKVIQGSDRLEQAQDRVTEAMKGGGREMGMLGHNLVSLGTFLTVASGNMGSFGGVAKEAGLALGGMGSAITTVSEVMRIAKVFMYGEMLPALVDYTAALVAAYGAEIALTGGLALAGGIIAAYVMSIHGATVTQDEFTSSVKRTGDAVEDTLALEKELQTIQAKLMGIPEDLTKAEFNYQSAVLDVADAQDKLNEVTKTGGTDTREYARAVIALGEAQLREKDTRETVNGLIKEKADLEKQEKNALGDLKNTTKTALEDMLETYKTNYLGMSETNRLSLQTQVDNWTTAYNFEASHPFPVQSGAAPIVAPTMKSAPELAPITPTTKGMGNTVNVTINNPTPEPASNSLTTALRAFGNAANQGGI